MISLLGFSCCVSAWFCYAWALAPPSLKWAKGYSFGDAESHPHAGIETSDGGFLMVGDGGHYDATGMQRRQILVLKTNATGDLEWQKQFGDCGKNYGKFGIELSDGTFLIAGAMCTSPNVPTVLSRVLLRLDIFGNLLHKQVFKNSDVAAGKRDGFMCVSLTSAKNTIIATGFVGGESAKEGYEDEPMFLISGGSAFIMKLTYDAGNKPLNIVFDKRVHATDFNASQGMRVSHDDTSGAYVLSIASEDQPGNFQFGLASLSTTDGALKWVSMFPAQHGNLSGHASHPYALALPSDGSGYVIGGLAVIYDSSHIEQCQGRLTKISPDGKLIFDRRFTSKAKDTNIECYGLQNTPDGGYILTCGTGVEPELHPNDSQELKTWMVLAHRTDGDGYPIWDTTYTSNQGPPFRNNAGEYIITTRAGEYVIYVDSQQYGSQSTGGNFAIISLSSDVDGHVIV